jgi:uracil-DNA glycosylase family 4
LDLFDPDPEKFSNRFVPPKGSNEPYLYICGEAPGYNESEQQLPFVGRAGQMLDLVIAASRIDTSKIRFNNVIPYRPIQKEGWKTSNRTPTNEEIDFYKVFVQKDIRKTKPKVIVVAGRSAMWAFDIKTTPTVGRSQKFEWEGIPVIVTWHPSYVMRSGGERSREFTEAASDLRRAWKEPDTDVLDRPMFEVVDVLDWSRVRKELDSEDDIILDYEASGLNHYEHTFILGGIALRGLKSRKTFYVKLYDFWRSTKDFQVPTEIMEDIGDFLSRKHLIVFNLQYEAGVTLTIFGKYLRNVTDVLIWNRMLGGSGSLKEVAQRRLGVRQWNSEVDDWNDIVQVFWKKCRPSHKGTVRKEIIFMREGQNNRKGVFPPPDTLEDWLVFFPEDLGPRLDQVYKAINNLISLAHKYYSGDRYIAFCKRFFDLVWDRTQEGNQEIRYTDIPTEIISPYAADDVSYTADLYLDMKKEIEEKEMTRSSEIFNNHAKLGFELESAGMAWDNNKAEELSNAYYRIAVDKLRSLLLYKKFSDVLQLSTMDILKIQTTQNLDDLKEFFNPCSTHISTRQKFSIPLVTGRVRFQMMLYDIYKEWIHRSAEEASIQWPVLWPIIECLNSLSSPTGEKTPDGKDIMKPSRDDVLARYVFIDGMVDCCLELGKKIQFHPGNSPDKWVDQKGRKYTPPEIEVFKKFTKWDLESMDAEIFETLYESFESIGGIDIDNQETWVVSEFKYLIDFRMYKKVIKSYTTYTWGSLGRDSIALIDRTSLDDPHQRRVPGHRDQLPNDKIWILQTEWSVCTAKTHRWRSGTQTVPSGSELLDLRVSRFPDGVRIHYDYSQNEVRAMARIANDANLLKAFSEGQDIHSYVASQVWRKPIPEIAEEERRFSKMCTFAILYGDSPSGFAVKFMRGDRKAAIDIFERMFTAFPTIPEWIKEQHRLALDKGVVYSLLGDPLDVGMPREAIMLNKEQKNLLIENVYTRELTFSSDSETDRAIRGKIAKALRNAQNYPIQGLSSMMAGLGIYYMTEYCRDNDLPARIDCFTHDSADIDTPLRDIPRILTALPRNAMDRIQQEFDIPVKTDFEVGLSGNSIIKLKNLQVEDNLVTSGFKGELKSLDKLMDRLELYGVKAARKIDKEGVEYKSMKNLFLPKTAYSMKFGTSYKVVEGSMELDFSNAVRA